MKKIIFLCIISALFLGSEYGQADNTAQNITIYYADKGIRRLIPVNYELKSKNKQKQAEEILKQIYIRKGDKILQLLSDNTAPVELKIEGKTICADLPSGLASQLPKNAETEKLLVYQLVNSLTQLDGIETVRFTVDSKIQRDFLGFLDMREIFAADYLI